MADVPPDGSFWAILVGGGSVVGVFVAKGFDYAMARLRSKAGDRRAAETGLGKLIKHLEGQIVILARQVESANEKTDRSMAHLIDCQNENVECRTTLGILTKSMNDMRLHIGMQLIEPEPGDG